MIHGLRAQLPFRAKLDQPLESSILEQAADHGVRMVLQGVLRGIAAAELEVDCRRQEARGGRRHAPGLDGL